MQRKLNCRTRDLKTSDVLTIKNQDSLANCGNISSEGVPADFALIDSIDKLYTGDDVGE